MPNPIVRFYKVCSFIVVLMNENDLQFEKMILC